MKSKGLTVPELASVEPTFAGARRSGVEHVQSFLVRFGYLAEALVRYQQQHGLPKTGNFDQATRSLMSLPRCGMPDLTTLGVGFSTACAWSRWNLTYTFDMDTTDCVGALDAVRKAFNTWAGVIPLTFTEVPSLNNPDIAIGWRPAIDPDLLLTSVGNMIGSVVAHADYPLGCSFVTGSLPKPLHFDETEVTWCIGAIAGRIDVETVALHELGHLLGLNHSTSSGSIMFPSVSMGVTKRLLSPDDIAGARSLYPGQDGWCWCKKCQGLFFGGNPNPKCPAGGPHEKPAGPGSYLLATNAPAMTGWQSDWCWCKKCQGLFFGGNPNPKCPAGGPHDKPASGSYSLPLDMPVGASQQSDWRWCNKCQGLFFGGNPNPKCPAGGPHDKTGSGNYNLNIRPM
jgi:hypothetical protein